MKSVALHKMRLSLWSKEKYRHSARFEGKHSFLPLGELITCKKKEKSPDNEHLVQKFTTSHTKIYRVSYKNLPRKVTKVRRGHLAQVVVKNNLQGILKLTLYFSIFSRFARGKFPSLARFSDNQALCFFLSREDGNLLSNICRIRKDNEHLLLKFTTQSNKSDKKSFSLTPTKNFFSKNNQTHKKKIMIVTHFYEELTLLKN